MSTFHLDDSPIGTSKILARVGHAVFYVGGDNSVPNKYGGSDGVITGFGRAKVQVWFPDAPRNKPIGVDPGCLRIDPDKPLTDLATLNLPPASGRPSPEAIAQAIADMPTVGLGNYRPQGTRRSDGERAAEGVTENHAAEALRKAFQIRNVSHAESLIRDALDAGLVRILRSDGTALAHSLEPIPYKEREDHYTHRWVPYSRHGLPRASIDEKGFLYPGYSLPHGSTPAAARTEWVILPEALTAFADAEKRKELEARARSKSEREESQRRAREAFGGHLEAIEELITSAALPDNDGDRPLHYQGYRAPGEGHVRIELMDTATIAAFGARVRELLDAEKKLKKIIASKEDGPA